MKKQLLFLLCLTFLLACKQEKNENAEGTNTTTSTTETSLNNSETPPPAPAQEVVETDGAPAHYKASADAPFVGFWRVEHALGGRNSPDVKADLENRWFHLKADNTFETGKDANPSNKGEWRYDEEKKMIQFYFANADKIPVQWRTKFSGDRVLLQGNTPKNQEGWQVMLTRETPTQ